MTEKDLMLMQKAYAGGKQPRRDKPVVAVTPEEAEAFLTDDGEQYDVERFIQEEILP